MDKTAYIATLVRRRNSYFLAWARMFGKSPFLGEKELFEGLAISSAYVDWKEHPRHAH
jgi:hypothetical protein